MIAEALLPPRVVVYEGAGAAPLAAADRSGMRPAFGSVKPSATGGYRGVICRRR
jgi:hypothetical protein